MVSDAVFLWFLDRHIGRVSENNSSTQTQQQMVCAVRTPFLLSVMAKKENHNASCRRGGRMSSEMGRNNQKEQDDN